MNAVERRYEVLGEANRTGFRLHSPRKIIYLPQVGPASSRAAEKLARRALVFNEPGVALPSPSRGRSTHRMADKSQSTDAASSDETRAALPAPAAPPAPPRRSPGHRGADMRDTVAEMAARAQEISQEAGSKMASAMKDVINAAAGLAGFAVESARDLVQFMVRRGQMTQEEADRLLREAEAAYAKRKPASSGNGDSPAAARSEAARAAEPARKRAEPAAGREAVSVAAPVTKEAAKPAAKAPAKTAAKAPAAKAPAAKAPAAKAP